MICGKEIYLGDGIYATFDGYQIWLRVDREPPTKFNKDGSLSHEIALEPRTMNALVTFANNVFPTKGDLP